jgi:hypothetical protein
VRTSVTAVFMALLTRTKKTISSGVTASAIRAKSQRKQNITMITATSVKVSVKMLRVEVDAKLWIVWTSVVRVLRMVPTRLVSY